VWTKCVDHDMLDTIGTSYNSRNVARQQPAHSLAESAKISPIAAPQVLFSDISTLPGWQRRDGNGHV
jgi:hypothetical protein